VAEIDPKAEKFLNKRVRNAYVTTMRKDGTPITIPVWYHWDGKTMRLFSESNAPKVKRLRRNPWISVVIGNELDEYEKWVCFEGKATLADEGGKALALSLIPHYHDLSDPSRQKNKAAWEGAKESDFTLIELIPERITTV